MRLDENSGGSVILRTEQFQWSSATRALDEAPLRISGDAARYNHRDGNDDILRRGNLVRLRSTNWLNSHQSFIK